MIGATRVVATGSDTIQPPRGGFEPSSATLPAVDVGATALLRVLLPGLPEDEAIVRLRHDDWRAAVDGIAKFCQARRPARAHGLPCPREWESSMPLMASKTRFSRSLTWAGKQRRRGECGHELRESSCMSSW